MEALRQLGYNPNRELPIVAQIKADVSKLGDKVSILARIRELDKALDYEADKKRLLWCKEDQALVDKREKAQRLAAARKRRNQLQQQQLVDGNGDNLEINEDQENSENFDILPAESKSNLKTKKSKSKFSKTISFNTMTNDMGSKGSISNSSFLERLIMVEDVNKPEESEQEVDRAVSVLVPNNNLPLD